jgi:uncharacterized protein HemX
VNKVNEVIIAAIAAGLGAVITAVGKVVVDIIKAKKEPDEADEQLKQEMDEEKRKNDAAIEMFTKFAEDIKNSVEELRSELTEKLEAMDKRIEEYRHETREINKSEVRHSIT